MTVKNFCYCTLALGSKYRQMAKALAHDLEQYSPGTAFYIYTDVPEDFSNSQNVTAFRHTQKGIQRCYNDKRFVIARALKDFPTVICIDSDTKILGDLPTQFEKVPGITGYWENLVEHVTKYRPHSLGLLQKIAQKLDISIEKAAWIGESLFIVTRDAGKEQEFLKLWGLIADYAQLRGMHSGEGNLMGLAAVVAGLKVVESQDWQTLKQLSQHQDASLSTQTTAWDNFRRRLAYHYRLNKARLIALKDFDFYYR